MTSLFLLVLVGAISVAVLLAIRWDAVGRLELPAVGLPPDPEAGSVGVSRSELDPPQGEDTVAESSGVQPDLLDPLRLG